jgi:para-aminobenzoate synthetase/4-amino-4-deoxychorismate lyase
MSTPSIAIQRPRPDERRGVIETILIFDDRPIDLDAHLARLQATVKKVYGEQAPDTRSLVIDSARGGGLGRMRLTVSPRSEGGLGAQVMVAPFDPSNVFPSSAFATTLKTMVVDRGYGEHKWADRELLTRAEAIAGPAAVPLLVSEEDMLLEASRANLFVVRSGTLHTPPLDGSILPGVTRDSVIEIARDMGVAVSEEPLARDALGDADEVFLTGSLRGVEPVRGIDEEDLAGLGRLAGELAVGLRERWFSS